MVRDHYAGSFAIEKIKMAKKTIAIIGATDMMGTAIAKSLSKGNYRLLLFGHDHDKLQTLCDEIKYSVPTADVDCLGCVVDASWEADIIFSTLPAGAEKEIAAKIREVATQKIVIVLTSPLESNKEQKSIGTSSAEELQKLLPHSKIVKTFNITCAADFARAFAEGLQVDTFITGDDKDAVQIVKEIVSTAGFHPIIAGELATSRALENT